jgi:hypothetical protein
MTPLGCLVPLRDVGSSAVRGPVKIARNVYKNTNKKVTKLKRIVPVREVCHAETLRASISGQQVIRRIDMMEAF